MKSLDFLFSMLAQDCASSCCTTTTRDVEYATRRSKAEGISFYTITLPTFCDDFDRSLADGRIAPGSFAAFKPSKDGPIPAFLQGMVRQCFGPDGVLLDEPSITAIQCIRQITRFAKKAEYACTIRRTRRAFQRFVDNERYLTNFKKVDYSTFDEVARILWRGLDNLCLAYPKHGPGAVAERLLPNQKWDFTYWYQRLQGSFPADAYIGVNLEVPDVPFLSPGAELPVRVITVPKTLTTPRIIAIEPSVVQYCQQSVSVALMHWLESHPSTRGRINFRDQSINARLALSSSERMDLASIDMKDASDLVAARVVSRMLRSCPDFRAAVFAARSTRAAIPGHGVLPLQKYASMGSALCFPIESMVFYTILVTGLVESGVLSIRQVHDSRRVPVWVYGDDIFCPRESAPYLVQTLERFGLKVNAAKSFWTGKFRESCGVDAYDGYDVTPTYLRRPLPTKKGDVRKAVSAVSFANQLHEKGFTRTAHYVRDVTQKLIEFPTVSTDSAPPYVAWTFWGYPETFAPRRWNDRLQREEIHTWVVVPQKRPDPISGQGRLLKALVTGSDTDDRLTSDSPGACTIKRRWCRYVM